MEPPYARVDGGAQALATVMMVMMVMVMMGGRLGRYSRDRKDCDSGEGKQQVAKLH